MSNPSQKRRFCFFIAAWAPAEPGSHLADAAAVDVRRAIRNSMVARLSGLLDFSWLSVSARAMRPARRFSLDMRWALRMAASAESGRMPGGRRAGKRARGGGD